MTDKYGNFTVEDGLNVVKGLGQIAQNNRARQADFDNRQIDEVGEKLRIMHTSQDPMAKKQAEKDLRGYRTSIILGGTAQYQSQQKMDSEIFKQGMKTARINTVQKVRLAERQLLMKDEEGAAGSYVDIMNKDMPDGHTYKLNGKKDGKWQVERYDVNGKLVDTTYHSIGDMRNLGDKMIKNPDEWAKAYGGARQQSRVINAMQFHPNNQKTFRNKQGDEVIGVTASDRDGDQMPKTEFYSTINHEKVDPKSLLGYTEVPKPGTAVEASKIGAQQALAGKYGTEQKVEKEKLDLIRDVKARKKAAKDFSLRKGEKIEKGVIVKKARDAEDKIYWAEQTERTKLLNKFIDNKLESPSPKKISKGIPEKAKPTMVEEDKILSPEKKREMVLDAHPDLDEIGAEVQAWVLDMPDREAREVAQEIIDTGSPDDLIELIHEFKEQMAAKKPVAGKQARILNVNPQGKSPGLYGNGIDVTP